MQNEMWMWDKALPNYCSCIWPQPQNSNQPPSPEQTGASEKERSSEGAEHCFVVRGMYRCFWSVFVWGTDLYSALPVLCVHPLLPLPPASYHLDPVLLVADKFMTSQTCHSVNQVKNRVTWQVCLKTGQSLHRDLCSTRHLTGMSFPGAQY